MIRTLGRTSDPKSYLVAEGDVMTTPVEFRSLGHAGDTQTGMERAEMKRFLLKSKQEPVTADRRR